MASFVQANLGSDSDSDDQDYDPTKEGAGEVVSEEEDSGDNEDGGSEKKSKGKSKKRQKKKQTNETLGKRAGGLFIEETEDDRKKEEEEERKKEFENEKFERKEEEEKKKLDDIWASKLNFNLSSREDCANHKFCLLVQLNDWRIGWCNKVRQMLYCIFSCGNYINPFTHDTITVPRNKLSRNCIFQVSRKTLFQPNRRPSQKQSLWARASETGRCRKPVRNQRSSGNRLHRQKSLPQIFLLQFSIK
jgi:hypothetical protein